jgi:hypothetical protein
LRSLKSAERDVLATAVVDCLVVATDPDARSSSIVYWERGHHWTKAVVDAVQTTADPTIRSLGAHLVDKPADPRRYIELRSALLERDQVDPSVAAIFELAWQAELNSRVGYHLGPLYDPEVAAVSVDELRGLPPGAPVEQSAAADVLVVVPFRDTVGGMRLRNLLACLHALRDQSFPRERYRVTVVEADEVPRWKDFIAPLADHYLFAPKSGAFNKSWTVNVGIVNTPGEAEAIGIVDGDVLADRDFVARNVDRFRSPGTAGHLTYRNMLCLDSTATSWAIRERLRQRKAEVDLDRLRCFVLRRPPGCCLWVRSGPFLRAGGMDERYEGWGGEDYDFYHRFDLTAPFDTYDDTLLHMYHPSAGVLTDDGEEINHHIPAMSWHPTEPIGRLDRFLASADA